MALPWLTEGMRDLAEAFGFGWIQAAGEAEAELAEMNRLGHIDAVMTDDSDVLLFGANVVIRNCELKRNEKHAVEVYRANAIFTRAKLSQADLLLYALLVGCDYDSMLFDMLAAHKDNNDDLRSALGDWRDHICAILRTDPEGFIGRTNRVLAARVPSSFPNIHVLHAFLSPPVLSASSYSGALSPRFIDFARLGVLCKLHFGWGNRPQLLQKCRNLFWSNEVVRMLVVEGLRQEEHAERVPAIRRLVGMAVEDVDEPPAFGYAHCRVRIFDDGIGDAITSALHRLREYHGSENTPQERVLLEAGRSATFRLPAVIVERARPLKTLACSSLHVDLIVRRSPSINLIARHPPRVSLVARSSPGISLATRCTPGVDCVARSSPGVDLIVRCSPSISLVARCCSSFICVKW
ncbi:hypothetical protein GSI_10201 [Ganoderma sinense ZZ0214-1]|uniref:XPG-I domain-containing protein n=1 Tax=Ganoderma sinense ZZ0214-1 TaxID=1077348 RepID=A0A2G8RZW8_9APHY|nr:hypothetical protein GSI_10201 [Ganoderma sinense ZZ0214-1]